jgi:hypothetical protein
MDVFLLAVHGLEELRRTTKGGHSDGGRGGSPMMGTEEESSSRSSKTNSNYNNININTSSEAGKLSASCGHADHAP